MKRNRIFIAIILTISLVLSIAPVYAAEYDAVSVNSVNIIVNNVKAANSGESFVLDNGNKVPYSILYKNTTYLPMRKIGEFVGKEVTYDKPTKTAYITTSEGGLTIVEASKAAAKPGTSETLGFSVNSLNIVVDGKSVAKVGDSYTLFDGTKAPFSILHKGTTYLPMRKIAELVDKNIGYIASTKTAELRDKVASYANYPSIPDFGLICQTKTASTTADEKGGTAYYYVRGDVSDAENEMFITNLEANGFKFGKNDKFPDISANASGYIYKNSKDKLELHYGAATLEDGKIYMFIAISPL